MKINLYIHVIKWRELLMESHKYQSITQVPTIKNNLLQLHLFFRLEVLERDKDKIIVRSGDNKAVVNANPIKIEFFQNDNLVAIVNGKGLFNMEHLRTKAPEGLVEKQYLVCIKNKSLQGRRSGTNT